MSPTYNSWRGMIARCLNPKSSRFQFYGARGIGVCKRWRRFENFLADMGERPEGLTLERKRNHLGYSPGNCKWATSLDQNNNTRKNVFVAHDGQTLTIGQWARRLRVNYFTLYTRHKEGRWPS